MKFIPITNGYTHDPELLTKKFPAYLRKPLTSWVFQLLDLRGHIGDGYTSNTRKYVKDSIINSLHIFFREEFPIGWIDFISFIFFDDERTANFLAYILQNFGNSHNAAKLENILSIGGSGYTVYENDDKYTLTDRVSNIIEKMSLDALNKNDLINEAWLNCYSRNPDYEKVVSRSSDFLESFLRDIYFPDDTRPQLLKFVNSFEKNPKVLEYKGSNLVEPKNMLTSLLKEASNIRGQHTKGKGRIPTKNEAEFVLNTTILVWNLHQK